jgi:hypothetical protein
MARDIRNEIDNKSSTRRRRRTRDISSYVAKQTTHQQLQTSGTPETPKSHRHVSGNSVFVSLSPQSPDDIDPTGDVLPVSNCSRSYLPCGCHGLPHCPVLLGDGSISASRKRAVCDSLPRDLSPDETIVNCSLLPTTINSTLLPFLTLTLVHSIEATSQNLTKTVRNGTTRIPQLLGAPHH